MRINIIFYYISKFAELSYTFLFITLFFTIIPPRYHMKRDERCAPRANPFVNAQTKFLIRAVDLVKMFSTNFQLLYLYNRYSTLFVAGRGFSFDHG